MANIDNNTIQLSISKESKYIEAIIGTGGSSIEPGMLCDIDASGFITPHSAVGGEQTFLFAVEDSYGGGDYSHAYVAEDRVFARRCRTGDTVLAWLAATESVVKGASLVSSGNGDLEAAGAAPITDASLVGIADEDVDATAARARITIVVY